MPLKKRFISPFSKSVWQTFFVFLLLIFSFVAYVYFENKTDTANDLRLHSILLADKLHQSSDDLTRMAKAYIATGKEIYKKHYFEIRDIQNGDKPLPLDYQHIYRSLLGHDDKHATLLVLMHQAGFTDAEFSKLNEAKKSSRILGKIEIQAMNLLDTDKPGINKIMQRQKAAMMLYSNSYEKIKTLMTHQLDEFYTKIHQRTSKTVEKALKTALTSRTFFIFVALVFFFMIWQLYNSINHILGGTIDEVQEYIMRIGKGDFSMPIKLGDKQKHSILGLLGKMQTKLEHLISNNERLKQLYAALSQCNQAIVRSKNQQELFDVICRDAVGFGGMEMAWIGMADKDQKYLEITSFYGQGSEYLENISISLEPTDETAQGPTGTAFIEDRAFWCQNFLNDPKTAPWHEKGKKFGWGSSAALPLHCNGITVGVFTIYSKIANVFDKSTQKLLEEMASDISFALEGFELERKRKNIEIALRREKETAQNYLDIVGVMILVLDTNKNVKLINRKGCEILGYDADELIGKNWVENFIPKNWKTDVHDITDELIEKQKIAFSTYENPILTKSGEERLILWTNTPLFDENGKNIGVLTSGEDITQRRASEKHIHYLANFDGLTGLANRTQLDIHIKDLIHFAKRDHSEFAVMFLDLDHFKDINDSLGHKIGDDLLISASHKLKSVLREVDTIARFGGDEFIVLLPNTSINGATQVTQKLLTAVKEPFLISSHELSISSSIGIAIYPHDGEDFGTLYKNADTAMYRAKKDGRNTFCFFAQEMQENSIRHLNLSNALRYAIERNQLEVYYQPQFSTKEYIIIGAEALLRWNHPEFGAIPPSEFIPIAEESGLILPIGEWVLREALKSAKQWIDEGLAPIIMAVNLSVVQFRSSNLTAHIIEILNEVGLPARYLELELTEGVAMHNPQRAISIMGELHAKGIKISIDDFGTGYSSLSYLKKFSIYKLKIDQSFVRDITIDPEDKAIVNAVISLAKSLGLKTIAEGVETIAQLDYLTKQGCDEIQGYYFSRPLPKHEFELFRNNLRFYQDYTI